MHTFSRSSLVTPRSLVFKTQPWDTMRFVGSAQPDRRTLRPSGFPIQFGTSLNAVGTVTLDRDLRLLNL